MNKKADEWWKLIVLIICACVFATIMLNLILSLRIPNIRIADNVWVGFWGSLIGSIVGGSITLIGIKITIDENKTNEEESKKFNVAPYLAMGINKVKVDGIEKEYGNLSKFTRLETYSPLEIDYNYLNLDLAVVNNIPTSIKWTSNKIERVASEVEPLLYMLTIENNGLNNAVYIYIEEVSFSDDVDGKSTEKIDNIMNDVIKDKCICTGIIVREKFGILLSLTFDKLDVEKTLYLSFRYNDLLGNTYKQKAIIRIQCYNSYVENRSERVFLEKIEYPDKKIIKLA